MGHGGKRANSGPKKGAKYQPTLDKEAAERVYRERMSKDYGRVMESQIESAAGVFQFVYRDDHGKFKVIDDPDEIAAAQNVGKVIKLFTRLPSPQAQTDVLNRMMGKPAEQVAITGKDSGPLEIVIKKPW